MIKRKRCVFEEGETEEEREEQGWQDGRGENAADGCDVSVLL